MPYTHRVVYFKRFKVGVLKGLKVRCTVPCVSLAAAQKFIKAVSAESFARFDISRAFTINPF